MKRFVWMPLWLATGLVAGSAMAQDVRLTADRLETTFVVNGQSHTIARNQDQAALLTGEFARTARACPPACITPVSAAPGVATVAELEVIAFLQTRVSAGTGLLLDSRLPEFHGRGSIPAAINVPFATLQQDNPYLRDILLALGAVDRDGTLDFADALDLMLFCDGAWSGQSPRAVTNLLAAGYPADKLFYYRGGMQDWLGLGLTSIVPGDAG